MCLCDTNENYLCFECECFYKDQVMQLIHHHKNEILEEKDWWWTINDYDINIFCYEDDPESPDAVFSINLYRLDREQEMPLSFEKLISFCIISIT